MFSLVAISWRRSLSRISLTSNFMTACDWKSMSKSATRSRSASHRSNDGCFNWMRASSSSRSPRSRCIRTDCSVYGFVIATSVSLPPLAENQLYCSGTWMRWTFAMRGPLSTRNSSIDVELHSPMSTRESLSAQLIKPITPVCTRCASRHSLYLRLSATSQWALFLSGPFSLEHTSSVSETLMWHTLIMDGDVSCGALYTSRRSPAFSRTRIARTTLFPLSARNSSSRAEL